ncbi:hypothetical protein U1Q18_032147 [Sarracenia purpurea var. burkii]
MTAYESALESCCDAVGECLCGDAQICGRGQLLVFVVGLLDFGYDVENDSILEIDGIAVALLLVRSAAAVGLALQQMGCGLVSFASVGKGFAIGLADPSSRLPDPCLWLPQSSSEAISVMILHAIGFAEFRLL